MPKIHLVQSTNDALGRQYYYCGRYADYVNGLLMHTTEDSHTTCKSCKRSNDKASKVIIKRMLSRINIPEPEYE